MKFLQKILHSILIVSIFLAPMDLSWAMEEEEEEEEFMYETSSRPLTQSREKDEEKHPESSDDEARFFAGPVEDVSSDSEEGEDLFSKRKTNDILQGVLEEVAINTAIKEVIIERFNQVLFSEIHSSPNFRSKILTPEERNLRNALREIGITDRGVVLIYANKNIEEKPTLSIEEIAEKQKDTHYSGPPDSWNNTDLFFQTLDQEFWLNRLPTSWKTRGVQIIPDICGIGPPNSLTAIIMFEVGYFFGFQDLNPAAYTMIAWLTTTLSPPLVRQFHERARIISRAMFGEEAFKPTGKSDSKPHVYNHNWLHKLAKGGIALGSFFNAVVYLGFFVWDVEDSPTDAGNIVFTVLTGVPLFLFFWDLFYSNASVALDHEFRKYYYEESRIIGEKRRILLEKVREVRCAINHPKATKFINTLFKLIIKAVGDLKEQAPSLSLEADSKEKVIAVTALLFKSNHRVSVPSRQTNQEYKASDSIQSQTPLNELLNETVETQQLFAKAQNFQDDLNKMPSSSWLKRGLGYLGGLIPGIRIYTQYIIFKHLWDLTSPIIAKIFGLDESIVKPMGYGISGFVTAMRTIAEKDVIKNWFQSLPSLFSFNQDMVGFRKAGRVVSLINATLLGLVEFAIAEFAYPDLNLLGKIILFGSNTIGTTAVFDKFLSHKTDSLITGIFTLDSFQKAKSSKVRRVFINYWLDQLKNVFEELDGESIEVIYSKTQNAV
jgi:hypothetical protein